MAVAGGDHGDAGGEVEEFVAVHVLDDAAAAGFRDQRIRAGVGGRDVLLVAYQDAAGVGSEQFGADARTDIRARTRNPGAFWGPRILRSDSLSWHGFLPVGCRLWAVGFRSVLGESHGAEQAGGRISRSRTGWDVRAKARDAGPRGDKPA